MAGRAAADAGSAAGEGAADAAAGALARGGSCDGRGARAAQTGGADVRVKRGEYFYAERFAVERDPEEAAQQQYATELQLGHFGENPVPEEKLWLRGVEIATNTKVVIEVRRLPYGWTGWVERELLAREVMALRSPYIVPVLHAGPGIVYAEPRRVRPRPHLFAAEAAACALQACEVAAQMHALGHGYLCFGPRHLRVIESEGGWRIAWRLPGRWALEALDRQAVIAKETREEKKKRRMAQATKVSPIAAALRAVVEFFAELLAPNDPAREGELERIGRGAPACADMVALARLFLPLVADPERWAARIEAMPVVRKLPKRERDWDAIIRDGEATLLLIGNSGFVTLPLACAYHQRACRWAAAGELESALADLERALALDPLILYAATRAVLRDRLGQRAAARAELMAALGRTREAMKNNGVVRNQEGVIVGTEHRVYPGELAHALEVAGLLALHDGEPAAAVGVLQEAFELDRTAARAHALGAALYGCGDVEAAAKYEARSVELAPEVPRYTWALVGSLLRLGRAEEARQHALVLLTRLRDDSAQREKFARVFGA
ncbi:hypothetical protein [Nannocystis sp. SCPEA4]|uniref:hypothetical protein n=1 Tax=Nannocystis sp. SCPEA4 TaxID=2996787 RepID=UPI002270F547|nr:hypothetical protein [Nannocystis sp. SCPEA4]MCY1054403.1 hypothetical protein [Nannocystis sp. SCPEA4]